ncbi:hypothetical protein [Paraburkholderia phenoliruptrix]|uniref:hypothetical protein n=1 Tax=Paraburkholderia phenoliruptrix TaxID=252970 RepID=UPI001C4F7819|nr:hypothetical protein [Paraburkholderia phenoliruptrix]MBW0447211.1 hypothetical protein [Paraburkholderia phenoliruptrix]MBW9101406.1 hypothetical protein [Paraburkholderia phenoliruptrix]
MSHFNSTDGTEIFYKDWDTGTPVCRSIQVSGKERTLGNAVSPATLLTQWRQ